jgi:tetratricopeptide (TPR) repeat protein
MRYLRATLPFILLAVATFAAYWNAWPEALVLDDKVFAGQERFANLSRLPEFFRETVWASAGADEKLYRPLLYVSLAIDATLFADRVAAWHLVNVFLHVLATLLVCLLLSRLLRLADPQGESTILIAVLAALVFGVHPIHAEVVNSIFNRSSLFVAIGSAAGLWWLLRHLDSRPLLAWTGIWLAYWFVLFSRETGIVLPALAVALVWIYSSGGWRQKAWRALPALSMAVPLLVYLAMRARAVAPALPPEMGEGSDLLGVAELVASGRLPDWSSVLEVAGVWLDGLRLVLWPRPLLVVHPSPHAMLQITGLFVHLGLVVAALYLYRRKRYGLITGLAIFYIALLPASRLFGSSGEVPHLAERYFYEPSIGLAVLLAFGLNYLLRRGDRLLAAAPAVLAVCLLTPVTWARNADWSDDVALLEHDYRHGVRTLMSLRVLTANLVLQGKYARVVDVCRENESSRRDSGLLSVHCGTAYAMSGDPQHAEQAFLDATADVSSQARAHSNLARLYVAQGRRDEARAHFERAIETEDYPATRAYRQGVMLAALYPQERGKLLEARAHFEEALRLQPRLALALNALEQVDRSLERLP